MTLTDFTSLASACLTADTVDERAALGLALAQGVTSLLGIGMPCGWREVEADRDADGVPMVRLVDHIGLAEPDEVRGMAIDMLKTADLVDAMRAADTARQGGES